MDITEGRRVSRSVIENLSEVVIADEGFLETILVAITAGGHVLLEDVPGTGKTLTARSFAQTLGLTFNRIQFTPDLLPTDVTGTNVFNERDREFEFSEGPIFANVVLADEINRAPAKTQAALLEAMEEKQVTIDGTTHPLPDPFFVIATQNPIEQEGTFRLPEAQIDRFMVKSAMGYPSRDGERILLQRRSNRTESTPSAESVIDQSQMRQLQSLPESVTVEPDLQAYMIDLVRSTRADSRVDVGVSPRGLQRLFEVSRARAVLEGRDYVVPDDVKRLAGVTLAHRLVLTPDAKVRSVEKGDVVDDVLADVPVPTTDPVEDRSPRR